MRPRQRSCGAMIALVCIAVIAQNPPLMGQADDVHGKVKWVSAVTDEGRGNFTYLYTAKNEDLRFRCKINWKTIGWRTTLLPFKEDVSKHENQPARPNIKQGEFRYNGGVAPGEGVKEGPAYVQFSRAASEEAPEQRIPRSFVQLTIPVSTTMNSETVTTYYPVDIHSMSSAEKVEGKRWRLNYSVRISPTKLDDGIPQHGVSDDVGRLLDYVRVEWESVASPLWSKMGSKEFNYGFIDEDRVLQFDRSGESSDTYELKVGLIVKQAPIFVSKSIRFVSRERSDGQEREVLAQAMLPAYAPQGEVPQE